MKVKLQSDTKKSNTNDDSPNPKVKDKSVNNSSKEEVNSENKGTNKEDDKNKKPPANPPPKKSKPKATIGKKEPNRFSDTTLTAAVHLMSTLSECAEEIFTVMPDLKKDIGYKKEDAFMEMDDNIIDMIQRIIITAIRTNNADDFNNTWSLSEGSRYKVKIEEKDFVVIKNNAKKYTDIAQRLIKQVKE